MTCPALRAAPRSITSSRGCTAARPRRWNLQLHQECNSAKGKRITAEALELADAHGVTISMDVGQYRAGVRRRAVRGLRIHYRQLRDAIAALRDELDHPADPAVDFTDIRQRLAWVLAGLRHQQARESDLIYEAYYDAVRSDIDEDAGSPPPGRQ